MTRFIDAHAHLDSDIYARDLDAVVQRARDEEVTVVTVGSDYASSRRATEIAERYDGVYAAVGLHPKKVPEDLTAEDKLLGIEKFHELASRPKVIAIGECGLDFRDLALDSRGDPNMGRIGRIRDNQVKVFGRFLELSRELRLPLILHCREAHDEMLELLETWDRSTSGFDARGIVHCFSGDWRQAKRYFNLDFMLSLTGMFSHGAYQAEIAKKAPLSRLVVESDCPYISPLAWAARRNEPASVRTVVGSLAALRGEPFEEVARETAANARAVFKKIR